MVRTRMPGGVGGKAREGLPIPICSKTRKAMFQSTLLNPLSQRIFALFLMPLVGMKQTACSNYWLKSIKRQSLACLNGWRKIFPKDCLSWHFQQRINGACVLQIWLNASTKRFYVERESLASFQTLTLACDWLLLF